MRKVMTVLSLLMISSSTYANEISPADIGSQLSKLSSEGLSEAKEATNPLTALCFYAGEMSPIGQNGFDWALSNVNALGKGDDRIAALQSLHNYVSVVYFTCVHHPNDSYVSGQKVSFGNAETLKAIFKNINVTGLKLKGL